MDTQAILERSMEKYAMRVIGDVRGKGHIQGTEMARDRQTKEPATREITHLFAVVHCDTQERLLSQGGFRKGEANRQSRLPISEADSSAMRRA